MPITKDKIIRYGSQTGKEIVTTFEELDKVYATIGPRLFHAIEAIGETRFDCKDEYIKEMIIKRYPASTGNQENNYQNREVIEKDLLDVAKEMDKITGDKENAKKRANEMLALIKQRKTLQNKLEGML